MTTPYLVDATKKTPYVMFDTDKGHLEIKGCSLPASAVDFYNPLFIKIEEYIKSSQPVTKIDFHIEYFNTSSSKILLQILMKFEILVSIGKEVSFNWLVDPDDVDMHDAGLTYKASVHLPTEIVFIE